MNWLNRASSLLLMGFSILIFLGSRKLGIGSPKNPGPGFFPSLASLLVFSLSLIVFIKNLIDSPKDRAKRAFIGWDSLKRPFSLLIALSGCAFFLSIFGYLITSGLLMFSMFSIYEPRKWYVHIFTSAVIASVSFIIFYKLLGVRFPTGILHIAW